MQTIDNKIFPIKEKEKGAFIFKALGHSPMFHFSLHAKELFHSNFLAWLGSDEELRPVFKSVMICLGIDKTFVESWGDNFEVLREKDNFDLVVKSHDGLRDAKRRNAKPQIVPGKWYVVIENKVKSIPNNKQLQEYKEKCSDDNIKKLLLVIFGDAKDLNNGWRRVNYTQVCNALKGSLALVTNDYKKAIIIDYIGMVEALVAIIKGVDVSLGSKYLYVPSKELNDLRIADLVDKWRAAQIANIINIKKGLHCNMGYTNKQSIIETFIHFNEFAIGIQIQGKQYRRCIIGNIPEDKIVEISKGFLKGTRAEFRNEMNLLYPGIFDTTPISGEGNRNYCSYGKKSDGETFWYQYVVIKEDATIGQIMECLTADMNMSNYSANESN